MVLQQRVSAVVTSRHDNDDSASLLHCLRGLPCLSVECIKQLLHLSTHRLDSSHLISSHLISSHLIASHLISSQLH